MIDIIITTYNSQDTLSDTLSSICNQKNIPKLCVYIIDDGSDCNYDDIINKYKNQIEIVFKKNIDNKGPGYARNDGIKISENKYIIFIDSDDVFYNDDAIYNLYNTIEKTNCDIVTSVIYEEKGNDYIIYANELIGLHGKIYRREMIEDNDVHFLNTYCNEDFYFNSLLRLYNAKIENINDVTYLWKENKNSITRATESRFEKDCLAFSFAAIKAIQCVLKKENINYDKIIDFCSRCIVDINYKVKLVSNINVINETISNVNKLFHVFKKLKPNEDIVKYLLDNKYIRKSDIQGVIYLLREAIDRNKKLSSYQRSKCQKIYYPLDREYGDIKDKKIELMKKFNQMAPYDYFNSERIKILKKMFGYYDSTSIVVPPIDSNWGCKNVYIGKRCYINSNTFFEDDGDIYIGDNVLIGKGTHLITINHMISSKMRRRNLLYSKNINIGNDVWIGSNVTIMPGVSIGESSVIGAGSVVTTDIPSNVIAAGNPCKVVRKISLYDELFFDDEVIDI